MKEKKETEGGENTGEVKQGIKGNQKKRSDRGVKYLKNRSSD